ncbi:MAG: hypothetical protein FWC72_03185 [Oscillospiraceae bacterium]|nr:hypothetical protein [Oscillospiraceae bacterium]
MMFEIFGILLFLVLLGLCIFLMRKFKDRGYRTLIILAALGIWALFISLPIEHWIYSFDSPESVIEHRTRDGEIIGIVYGNHSYLVSHSDRGETNELMWFIARRTEDEYKLPAHFETRRILRGVSPNTGWWFEVYHVRNTSDYFIRGRHVFIGAAEEEVVIRDRNYEEIENIFFEVVEDGHPVGDILLFYMFVENFIDGTYLIIDGRRVDIPPIGSR